MTDRVSGAPDRPGGRVAADFDRVASAYDLLVGLNPGYRRHLRRSAERLDLDRDARILDLCCGTGQSTLALRAAYPRATLCGLDAADEMLQVARTRTRLAGVHFVHGDAMNPGAAGIDGPFDGILMAYGIRNVPDADACLQRVRGLLAPGAPVCFHEYSVTGSPFCTAVWEGGDRADHHPRRARGDRRRRAVPLPARQRPGVRQRGRVRAAPAAGRVHRRADAAGGRLAARHRPLVPGPPPGSRPVTASEAPRVAVVGGGIAGMAAAVVLVERGIRVTVLEREPGLGGRAGAFPVRLSTGETVQMDRGFHAFFRQYYNLRALLRRISPDLDVLEPLDDYPILGLGGARQSFARLPRRAPWNIVALTRRTPSLTLSALRRVRLRSALSMLAFDAERTYERHDGRSATEYLDSLRFPPDARQLLFDVFAHSFFNPEGGMSAAELLMMFHFYFTGNPEGLPFDVAGQPFSTGIWEPMRRYVEARGAAVRTGTEVRGIRRAAGCWTIDAAGGSDPVAADGVVLALDVAGLKRLLPATPFDRGDWAARVRALEVTLPFAVWRLWLDRPTAAERAPFAGTAGFPLLDNISLFHQFEDESRAWAHEHGGSVVELHAYAVPDGTTERQLRTAMLRGLHELYPETRGARPLDEVYLLRNDCPAFAPGSRAGRPGVETPHAGLYLAGDFVRIEQPSALMERAAASGIAAANAILAEHGLRPEPVASVRPSGILPAAAA